MSGMRNWHKVVLIVTVLTIGAASALYVERSSKPTYDGRTLTGWLLLIDRGPVSSDGGPDAYADQRTAYALVRRMGTNTISTLLMLVRTPDSRTTSVLRRLLPKQSFHRIRTTAPSDLRLAGLRGFQILGTNAQVAIPALLGIATVR